ncbi:L-2-hydroxyglutarate oxidase [Nocardia crassostreae]|uniref:L-2-hydroxyglutarate oxidase n=1 Tax=Nocardia crassostreae TaxID=53428 RepID=UPI000AA4F245
MYDYCVIGGGIVGVATAHRLLEQHPGASLLLLENDELAVHQTGHNSGVIHSGIYYEPGSLKARLCRQGAAWTKELAAAHDIPFEECGKLLVATDSAEYARMLALYERSVTNDVEVELLDAAELVRREPRVTGVGALFVPSTGIIDYTRVTRALAQRVRAAGGELVLGAEITAISENDNAVTVSGPTGSWRAARLVVCAGLQADRLARLAGLRIDLRIVPFRGEYYRLPPHRKDLVRTLIYPIPDPELPFLGVHLSPTIDGELTVGPNAVLGLAREGYRKGSVDIRDAREILGFRGFHRVAAANVRDRFAGNAQFSVQARISGRMPALLSRADRGRSAAARGGHSRAGGAARRDAGARFPDRTDAALGARAQRALARGHLRTPHRRAYRRAIGQLIGRNSAANLL